MPLEISNQSFMFTGYITAGKVNEAAGASQLTTKIPHKKDGRMSYNMYR
jgi:hypothetical protein